MNRIILRGRLGRDPETRTSKDGKTSFTRFSIAVKDRYKKDETDWINCLAFNTVGETIEKYLGKGDEILLEGRLKINTYKDKDGNQRTSAEVNVDSFEYVSQKKEKEEPRQEEDQQEEFTEIDEETESDDDLPF